MTTWTEWMGKLGRVLLLLQMLMLMSRCVHSTIARLLDVASTRVWAHGFGPSSLPGPCVCTTNLKGSLRLKLWQFESEKGDCLAHAVIAAGGAHIRMLHAPETGHAPIKGFYI